MKNWDHVRQNRWFPSSRFPRCLPVRSIEQIDHYDFTKTNVCWNVCATSWSTSYSQCRHLVLELGRQWRDKWHQIRHGDIFVFLQDSDGQSDGWFLRSNNNGHYTLMSTPVVGVACVPSCQQDLTSRKPCTSQDWRSKVYVNVQLIKSCSTCLWHK